jgi:hypothetical protein
MSTPKDHALEELFRRYVGRQVQAHAEGHATVDASGEVQPFEAVPAQPVDPRLAWDGACAVFAHYQPANRMTPPADWPALVAAREPATALAFAAGNYPQLLRDVHALLQPRKLSGFRAASGQPLVAAGVVEWTARAVEEGLYPRALVGLGIVRVAGDYAAARDLAEQMRSHVPAEWQAAFDNEIAALTWDDGRAEEAYSLWQHQAPSVPVLFNRGMAALFLDRPRDARPVLVQAVEGLPDQDAWHHLGRLYLALATMAS